GGADLGIVQAEGVDEVVIGLAGNTQRDVVVDQLGPAEVIEDAIGGGELDPGRPFLGADSSGSDVGVGIHGRRARWQVEGIRSVLEIEASSSRRARRMAGRDTTPSAVSASMSEPPWPCVGAGGGDNPRP